MCIYLLPNRSLFEALIFLLRVNFVFLSKLQNVILQLNTGESTSKAKAFNVDSEQ